MKKCDQCGYDPDAEVFARWEIELPVEPPTQNKIFNKGGNRHRYKKYRDDYEILLLSWKNEAKIPEPGTIYSPRRVFFTRLYKHRGYRRDKINNAGGMKPLLDAMVNVGLLANDTEDDVEDYYGQELTDRRGVRIVLEEIR